MSVVLIEKPERSGDSDATSGSGTWEFVARVTGEANLETALLGAIVAYTGFRWYNLSLRRTSFKELGGDVYSASVDWKYEVPDSAAQSPTDSPGPTDGPLGTSPSGTPAGITSDSDFFGPDVSFEVGGRPGLLTMSKEVVYTEKAGSGNAPDYGLLMGIEDGQVKGIEVDDPDSVMTVDRTFDRLCMADIMLWESGLWKKNGDTWWGRPAGELTLMGFTVPKADPNGRRPCVFRFGLKRTEVIKEKSLRDEVGKNLPHASDVTREGWDVLDTGRENVDDAALGLTVSKPAWMRVHRIFDPFDYRTLGIGG